MPEIINGFLVLRKSLDGMLYSTIWRHGDKAYLGWERMHMEDVIEDYYSKKLPDVIARIYKDEGDRSNDWFGLHYIKEYSEALQLFHFVNTKNDLNELIVISSDIISQEKGSFLFEGKVEWLGYDVIAFGSTSLILNGVFFKPSLFEQWMSLLNKNGLFDSKDHLHDFLEDYFAVANTGVIENYNRAFQTFDAVRIGRVAYRYEEKHRLYWMMDNYLSGEINAVEFCDQFYSCYDLELDHSTLSELEEVCFSALSRVASRYSEFGKDHQLDARVFTNDEELGRTIIETKEKLTTQKNGRP